MCNDRFYVGPNYVGKFFPFTEFWLFQIGLFQGNFLWLFCSAKGCKAKFLDFIFSLVNILDLIFLFLNFFLICILIFIYQFLIFLLLLDKEFFLSGGDFDLFFWKDCMFFEFYLVLSFKSLQSLHFCMRIFYIFFKKILKC